MPIPVFRLPDSFLHYILLCVRRAGQKITIKQRIKIIVNKGVRSLIPQNSMKSLKKILCRDVWTVALLFGRVVIFVRISDECVMSPVKLKGDGSFTLAVFRRY